MPQGVVSPRVGLAASWQSAVQTLVHPNGLNLKGAHHQVSYPHPAASLSTPD
ncbi:hypothetical protein FH972_025574 [Carpinus fangiana]|uniref:Uncharacterized protein n=1 Tax=Carpinus fangiana TaxID=176857 RepID=A0A5N6L1U4_9ROSI|nr:hypothetical protein FH972_025574 [Carpinus fangiana]